MLSHVMLLSPPKRSLGQGNVLHLSVCSRGGGSTYRGGSAYSGLCIRWGLHPEGGLHAGDGSTSREWVCIQGRFAADPPPEREKHY